MRTGKARASIEGHSGAARDEFWHVGEELRSQLHAAGAPTPTIDRLLPRVEPTTPTWPDGAREIPLRWCGIIAPGLALAALAAGALRLVRTLR